MRYGTEIRQACATKGEAENLAGFLSTLVGCIRTGVKSSDRWREGEYNAYGVFKDDCGAGPHPASMFRVCLVGSDEKRANEMESVPV